jgi:prophage DNA circulation protein
MPEIKATRGVRDDLFKAFEEMVTKAMRPDIPIPQRQAMFNRAQELRAQWVELESARFNSSAEAFEKAQAKVRDAVTDLRLAVKELDDMVKIAEKATKVFGLVDKLLKTAVKFVAF